MASASDPVARSAAARPAAQAGGQAGGQADTEVPRAGSAVRSEELSAAVLASVGIGAWRWNRVEGVVEADARTRELLGLPLDGPMPSAATIRARLHGEDFVRLSAIAQLSASEQRAGEARVRLVSPDGRLLRTLHLQISPGPPDSPYSLQGTVLDGQSHADDPGLTGDPSTDRAADPSAGLTADPSADRAADPNPSPNLTAGPSAGRGAASAAGTRPPAGPGNADGQAPAGGARAGGQASAGAPAHPGGKADADGGAGRGAASAAGTRPPAGLGNADGQAPGGGARANAQASAGGHADADGRVPADTRAADHSTTRDADPAGSASGTRHDAPRDTAAPHPAPHASASPAETEDRARRQIHELNTLPATAPRLPAADLRRSREAFLLDAGRALAEASTTSEVLRVAATLAMPGFSPDAQAVFGVQGTLLTVVGQHGHDPDQATPFEMPLDTEYPAAQVVRTGRPIYLSSPAEYQRRFPATWPLAEQFHRRSWAFLPLVTAGRTTGAWLAAFEMPVEFTPDERAVLSTVARMLSQALERAHTNEAERALSRGLRRSMGDSAREIDGLTVTARYVPTGGGLLVGGDWYDVIDLPGGRIALVVGDVQGHDVHAAGVMSRLRTAVHAYAVEGHRPDAVLSRASRFLASVDEDRFATCLYIEADPARGRLEIARAGHPHPVLRMPDGTCVIRHVDGGLPLGLAPEGEDYPVTELDLQVGEVLMVCTDGLIETGGHDMFSGWIRVRDVLAPGPASDLEGMADALIRAVHGPASHRGGGRLADRREDDIALLLLRRDAIDGAPQPVERRLVVTVGQGQPARIASARRELRGILQDWNSPEAADAAVLLVSELLTNVLLHTDQEGALKVELSGTPGERRLRIEVSDGSDELPHLRSPGEMASNGRGLVLLDLLADRWGVRPSGEGKVVWFEMSEKKQGAAAAQPSV